APQALGDRAGLREIDPGQDDAEFLTAVAAQEVAFAQSREEAARDDLQREVAQGVAVAVVQVLEVVDVDHDARERLAAGLRLHEQSVERLEEGAAIETPGERVARREVAQFLVLALDLRLGRLELLERGDELAIQPLELRDVRERNDAAAQVALPVEHRGAVD